MSLKNYKKITTIANRLVKENIHTFIFSNNFLVVVKEHPLYTSIYSDLSYSKSFLLMIKYFFLTLADLFFSLINFTKNIFLKKIKLKKIQKNIIIISHLLNENSLLSRKDFYFGDLEKNLLNQKIKYQKLYINHTNYSSNFLNSKNKNENIFILNRYQNISNEFIIFFLQIRFFLSFLYKSYFEKELRKKFILRAAVEFLNLNTKNNYRIALNINDCLKLFNPKKLILTFEGFPWEKLVFSTAKEFNKDIIRIGYQHAGLTKNQSIIKTRLKNDYEPDLVWVTGKKVQKILKNRKTLVVGSYKVRNKIKLINSKKINCLVVPEGIKSECKKMFQFSIDSAKMLPNINFIWRLHPILDFKHILRELNYKKKLPKNIIISKNKKVDYDIAKSKICIFRGSSVVFNALSSGLFAIYLNLNEKISIDSSNGLKCWKMNINDVYQFKNFINNLYRIELKKIENKKIAMKYSSQYFEGFNMKQVLKNIKN